MNKISISYDKNKIDKDYLKNCASINIILLKKDEKSKDFFNINDTGNLENISKSKIYFENDFLKTIGGDENEATIIPKENKNFDIIGVLPKEINFRELSKLIKHILIKLKRLNLKNLIQLNISNCSEDLQVLICSCFEYNNYNFKRYLKNSNNENSKEDNSIEQALLIISSLNNSTLNYIEITSKQTSYCRDLVNSNASEITSEYLHEELESFSKIHELEFKAFIGKELLSEKMNLHYQVGKSAQIPPRMLCAVYNGDSNNKDYSALIGKGITFDTGGLNLKPTGAIEDMKLDMGGAATTLSAFKALIEMKVKKNIILVLACAENAIDSKSYKPGDVFISRKGISVEITNTDAEGRLALADCMDYIQDKYSINEIIDCATLTGASMIALGLESIAMFSNDNAMARNIYQCSKDSYELMWRLPIFDEHREVLQSNIANCSNAGSGALRRFGGASSAAAFLEQFIKENVKWVHLDIAGASFNSKTGASGCGVRTLVKYLK